MDDGTQITAKPRKRKPRRQHPDKRLSAAFVRNAPVGRHCDGNGLYLVVKPTGTRSWIQRIAIRGRRRDIGLGSVRLVPLAEAREKALVNRKLARDGGDPLADRRRAKRIPLFAAVAERVWNQLRQGWRHPRHARDWWRSFENHVLPRIGQRPVSEVTAADVLEILEPIWHTKPKLARRLRQRIRAVLECAVALEHRADNPCDRLGPVLGPHDLAVRHFEALPHAEVAAAVAAVHGSRALPALKLAFEFLVLTAGRSGGVAPISWTPNLLVRRSPRCRSRDRRTRRHSGSRWSSWFGPDVNRESWLGSSSRRPRPYENGSRRQIATRERAATG